MAKPRREDMARAILARYPKSHAEAMGIRVSRNTPAPLCQWLVMCLLFSAPIAGDQAEKAGRALFNRGWRTARKMAASTWRERVTVLNRAGYARYDESTARYIGDAMDLLLESYGGDLRRLRKAAGGDAAAIRERLKAFKGIGDVGADIFCREVQVVWDELAPFADKRALQVAGRLGLGRDASMLAGVVGEGELPRLLSGLVRMDLAGETEAVRDEAA